MKKKLLKNMLVSTMLISSLASVTPVVADSYDTELQEAEEKAQQHEEAANNLDNLMRELTSEVTDTQTALNNLKSEIHKNEIYLEEAVIALETAYQEMIVLEDEITVLEEKIESRAAQLEEQARKIQVNGNSASNIDFILNADSLTDVIGRIDIVSKVVDTSSKMLEDQMKDKMAVVEKTEETERKIVQQNALAEELENTSADLEAQKISQEALVAQLKIEQSTIASEKNSLIAQRDDALRRANEIQNEREEVRLAAAEAEESRQTAEVEEEVNQVQNNVSRPATSETARAPETSNSNQASTVANNNTNSSSNSSSNDNSNSNQPVASPTPSPAPTPTPTPSPAPTKPTKPKPDPKPDPAPVPAPSGNVLSIASQYLGTPYLYGGSTTSAFDCSGYTKHVFAQAGKNIPRNSGAQYASSVKVTNPQPGDLVFFGKGSVTHVGIYVGGGRFIGSQTSTGVAYASATTGYWGSRLIGYGRY